MRYFCSYFDINYLPRALALYRSLRRHAGSFRLYALCFDEASARMLADLALEGVETFTQADLEAGEPRLASARVNRTRFEYYFTCTPAMIAHVLARHPEIDVLTYLDADLYFYSSPEALYDELGDASVLIYPHRFSRFLRSQARFGVYNVGYLSFRNDDRGRTCLHWWRDRCIEWCYDRLEGDRFADQKYLDVWPSRFGGVVVGRHPGSGLASWNIGDSKLNFAGGSVLVDGRPLVFYHFHGLRIVSPFVFYDRLLPSGVLLGPRTIRHVYRPYLEELSEILRQFEFPQNVQRRAPSWASARGLMRYAASSFYVLFAAWIRAQKPRGEGR